MSSQSPNPPTSVQPSKASSSSSPSTQDRHLARPIEQRSKASPASGSPSSSSDSDSRPPSPTLPLSLSTSTLLSTQLPQDLTTALAQLNATLDATTHEKVTVRFQPLGSAPILKQKVFKILAASKFGVVVASLRKKLGVKAGESLFCYVNSVFAPGLDEGVGPLWKCFKTDDQLIVAYSMTPAFG